jgi:DMSO reductase anchor subunit
MKNWRTSWLSREAIALGAFTALASVVAGMYFLEIKGMLLISVEALTLAIGIYGIYAQSMIYRIKARPSWDRKSTTKRFFGSSYVGFLLIATALLIAQGSQGVMVLLAITLLTGMVQVLVIWEEILFYKHLNKEDVLFYQYNRSKILLNEHFPKIKYFRLYSLGIFALILPLLAILFVASGLMTFAILTLILATLGALLSELSGRYLFYRTVVPLGLAGNFFAGNQR